MGKIFSTAGSRYYIGPVIATTGADLTESDFTTGSPVFTEIGGTTNIGQFGDTAEVGKSNQIAIKRTRKFKGPRDAGSTPLIADLDYSDPGQLALIAAEKTDFAYMFKVQFNDAPQGGTPSIRYFAALVMSATEQLDEATNQMKFNAGLEIDSNIVRVAATA